MITVCPTCSGVDIDLLENTFGKENIELTCISECGGMYELVIGYKNGKFIEAESEEEFINKLKDKK